MTGTDAFTALKEGHKIRRIMWTAGCYVYAEIDTEENTVYIKSSGTAIFQMDIATFKNMILEQLLEDAEFDAWEVVG